MDIKTRAQGAHCGTCTSTGIGATLLEKNYRFFDIVKFSRLLLLIPSR